MISVAEALEGLFALVAPLPAEDVPLRHACGRVLAADAVARRDQPPFPASAMDGYAVRDADARPGAALRVVGEAAAGHAFGGRVGAGEAVRIFTGAPVPEGADRVVIQEDVTRDGDTATLGARLDAGPYVRPAGGDFRAGHTLPAGRRLTPADVALLASMNIPVVSAHRRPMVALLATGDELVTPGETPGPDQIIASNTYGLAALLEREGAACRILPIARDTVESLQMALALSDGADLVLTTGGASVGDHDLMAQAAAALGLERSFYKVAMRPGKPLMAGRCHGIPLIGLPGNPVSTMVCGTVFVLPTVRRMMGLPAAPAPRERAPLAHDLPANGPREHYMRARLDGGRVEVFDRQDSSLQRVLSEAAILAVRPPADGPRLAGETIDFLRL